MTDRNEKRDTGVQATGGDKGSKNTNDFEVSGRDRNADKGSHNPENLGREGMDNEKVSRRSEEKSARGTDGETAGSGNEKPNRERTTEAALEPVQKTANRHHPAPDPVGEQEDDKKPRKTSKREKGSRKPGTELTKYERDAVKAASA